MAEFLGAELSIALQKRLRSRQPVIDQDINLVNGGRLMHALDPDQTGWEQVITYAEADGVIGFPAVKKSTIGQLKKHLGDHWNLPVWNCFVGDVDTVLQQCQMVIETNLLDDSWTVHSTTCPIETEIDEVQQLNLATGVLPYPGYYMRSEIVPMLTSVIRNHQNALVATASVVNRHDPACRLGGSVFAGNVSVSPTYRGKGLGKLINAICLRESAIAYGWNQVIEQAHPDNAVSRSMIEACGLHHKDELVTIGASLSSERFTR